MILYYFDIETTPLKEFRNEEKAGFDPVKAKVITMQYQKLHPETGDPMGGIIIKKEWEDECSEKKIVQHFKELFIDDNCWTFVPVGNTLDFDLRFMKAKLQQYFGNDTKDLEQKFYEHPRIDLKDILIFVNDGKFKGYSELIGKNGYAKDISKWYYAENYPMIEGYVQSEAWNFIRVYKILRTELPKVKPLVIGEKSSNTT